ncbi:MAG: PspC domain-containing protein [Bacteroidaceae bacterium]|nr:PspC domain-containing protein [Bacteroidaceae bacterium]
MKKSFEVNLGGRIFNFDEDAYELLNNYIKSLEGCFSAQDGGEEIIADIEVRLSELCETRMHEGSARIVDFSMIDEFITRMGRPESLAQEVADEQNASADAASSLETGEQREREPWRDAMLLGKKLFRDTRNGLLGGVLSGLAAYTDLNVWLLRVIAILLFIFVGGIIVPIVYVVAWLALPMAVSVTDIMRMRDIKAASGERVEEAWAREYERSSAEIMNGGVVRDNKGCLSGCIIALLLIILLPIILFIAFFGYIGNIFYSELPFSIGSFGGDKFIELSLILGEIVYPFLIFIPIFLIGHYLLKKKNKVRPLKKWLKIFLIALWVILLGIFLGSDNKKIKLPFFKYEKRVSKSNNSTTMRATVVETPIEYINSLLSEFEKIAASPEATTLKNYFLAPDNYPDSKNCTRILWHYITSANNDSLLPYVSECIQLDDKVIWRLMPRGEWVENVNNLSFVSKVEIAGSEIALDAEKFSSAEICCVVDTLAKRMFVDLSRCKGLDDLNIEVNSIPGWTVDYVKDASFEPENSDRVELILKLSSLEGALPKLVVRTSSSKSSETVEKDVHHTVWKQRSRE